MIWELTTKEDWGLQLIFDTLEDLESYLATVDWVAVTGQDYDYCLSHGLIGWIQTGNE